MNTNAHGAKSRHAGSPNSTEIYAHVASEGVAEMRRPSVSLFWSALAAGLLISFSLVGKAALQAGLHGIPGAHVLESLGYTLGFVLVILSRLQLFTENTISPVLPTIAVPSVRNLRSLGRIWCISFGANLLGTCIMALLFARLPLVTPEVLEAIRAISVTATEPSFGQLLVRGIPSGLLIATLVWMRPSAGGAFLGLIIIVTYFIALAEFSHVVVGSCEVFFLAWSGHSAILPMLYGNILPTLIGNMIGGTGLFALISWAQIRAEVEETVQELRSRAEENP